MCDGLWDICVSVHLFTPRQCRIIADGNRWPDNETFFSVAADAVLAHTEIHTHTHTACKSLVRDRSWQHLRCVACYGWQLVVFSHVQALIFGFLFSATLLSLSTMYRHHNCNTILLTFPF